MFNILSKKSSIDTYKINEKERRKLVRDVSIFLKDHPSEIFMDNNHNLLPDNLLEWALSKQKDKEPLFLIKNIPITQINEGYGRNPIAETFAYTLLSFLGAPLGVSSHKNGTVSQDLYPRIEDKGKNLKTSGAFLPSHTENAHLTPLPEYMSVICLRGRSDVTSFYTEIKPDEIPEHILNSLTKEIFVISPDVSFSKKEEYTGPIIKVEDEMIVRYDPQNTKATTNEGEVALEWLVNYVEENQKSIVLETGDLFVVRNYNVVHGRSAYEPKYNGRDRWLKRINVYPEIECSKERVVNKVLIDH